MLSLLKKATRRLTEFHKATYGEQIEDKYMHSDMASRRGYPFSGVSIIRDMRFRLTGWRGMV